jgi:hypothetical protein
MAGQPLSTKQTDLARSAIRKVDPSLEKEFICLMQFLALNPDYRGKIKGKNPPSFGTKEYFKKTASKFSSGRVIPKPTNSGKKTDPLLMDLFGKMNQLPHRAVQQATKQHGDFMVIENVVGKMLEKYLASKLEPIGWVWCSGDFVDKVDFIHKTSNGSFEILQIKNKDVTENSSSAAGRAGVPKWGRLKGKQAKPDWDNFPNEEAKKVLSEEDFLTFGAAIGEEWFKE